MPSGAEALLPRHLEAEGAPSIGARDIIAAAGSFDVDANRAVGIAKKVGADPGDDGLGMRRDGRDSRHGTSDVKPDVLNLPAQLVRSRYDPTPVYGFQIH